LEGLFFFGAFSCIFWFKSRNLLPGLCTANQFIAKDESSHKNFAVMIYHKLLYRLSQEEIEEIFNEAISIEQEFITESISCSLVGIKPDDMKQFIKYVADRLIQDLGYAKIYNTQNPFQFVEFGSLENKTNFFEKRVTEYSNVGATQTANLFDENVDF
jgi:ribonucleotide reductase beta subunit family protein with ferritin-like domain